MLLTLSPGLKCKKCGERMKFGREVPGFMNVVLSEDKPIGYGKFDISITCDVCSTPHKGKGFINDGIFRGIYQYDIQV